MKRRYERRSEAQARLRLISRRESPRSRIRDGEAARARSYVINNICLASDSAPDGTFLRNERPAVRTANTIRPIPIAGARARARSPYVSYTLYPRAHRLFHGGARELDRAVLARLLQHRQLKIRVPFPPVARSPKMARGPRSNFARAMSFINFSPAEFPRGNRNGANEPPRFAIL